MKNFLETFVILVLVGFVVSQTTADLSNFARLGLNSTQSQSIMQPFLSQNPSINSEIANFTTLNYNNSFLPLFNYILSNSTIYDQLLPNISTVQPLLWTNSLNQSDKQALIQGILTNTPTVLYSLMMDHIYPANQTQCQLLMQAVISTNIQSTISTMLTPLTGNYFWTKRCILILTSFLYIVDNRVSNLTYQQKISLIPTIKRMRVVHSLIFNLT